jgi:hypothetical protein
MPESWRSLTEPGPEFNPRIAALAHAAAAEGIAPGVGPVGTGVAQTNAALERVVAQAASAVACGLVYVGDQIGRVVDHLEWRDRAEGRVPQEHAALTFAEMRPAIRSQATALLWEKREMLPEHTEEWVEDVLSIAETIIDNNGGASVSAGG